MRNESGFEKVRSPRQWKKTPAEIHKRGRWVKRDSTNLPLASAAVAKCHTLNKERGMTPATSIRIDCIALPPGLIINGPDTGPVIVLSADTKRLRLLEYVTLNEKRELTFHESLSDISGKSINFSTLQKYEKGCATQLRKTPEVPHTLTSPSPMTWKIS